MGNEYRIWDDRLYHIQLDAPKPIPVCVKEPLSSCPLQYDKYYHGSISQEDVEKLLSDQPSGSFMIRDSLRKEPDVERYTLAIKYDDDIKIFKLYYNKQTMDHYVGEKMFRDIFDLVKDGLIHFHILTRGADILDEIANGKIYEESPYRMRLNQFERGELSEGANCTKSAVNPHRPLRSEPPKVPAHRTTFCKTERSSPRSNSDTVDNGETPSLSSATESDVAKSGEDNMLTLQIRYNIPPACVNLDDQVANHHSPPFTRPQATVQKAHVFKTHTFVGSKWCDYCKNFLWGLILQGVRCADCGFAAHKKCSENTPEDCMPDMKYMKRVFDVDLISLLRAECRSVPLVLEKCVLEVEARDGLSSEGLYRIPGNHDMVESLRKSFDKNVKDVDLTSSGRLNDINVLTSLIKRFMRQLPNPVVPFEIYDEVVELARLNDETPLPAATLTARYRALMHRMPLEHYETLRFFLGHICRVAANSDVNMMTVDNLALVLTPSLIISTHTNPSQVLRYTRYEQMVIRHLITHYDRIFAELDKEIR